MTVRGLPDKSKDLAIEVVVLDMMSGEENRVRGYGRLKGSRPCIPGKAG